MSSLPVVFDGVREPVIDLVSIPGLPDLLPQYKLKDHNQWLRDVVSHQIPGARIMAYQYDFANFPANLDWKDFTGQSSRLLYALVHRRENQTQINRPIVFICYSFGAIILKKALLEASQSKEFRSILDSTAAILFLGCLHNGTHPEIKTSCLRCAAVELQVTSKRSPVIESLKNSENWSVVKEVMESFKERTSSFSVRSFFELRTTIYEDHRFKTSKSSCLISESLSTLGWDTEKTIAVDADHVRLSTFPNRADTFFDTLMENLTEIVNDICPPLAISNRALVHRTPSVAIDDWTQLVDVNPSTVDFQLASGTASPPVSTSIDPLEKLSMPNAPRIPCFVTTPHQENPEFVGRTEILQKIHSRLAPQHGKPPSQQIFALCGLGGMGKTQIAISYVFAHRADFAVVLWAHAHTEAKLAESFSRFTVELGLRAEIGSDQNTAKHVLKTWLEMTDESWLLVFDNADSEDKEDLLKEFWPQGRGSILITSRDKNLISQFDGVELSDLDKTSAIDLLLKLTKSNHSSLNDELLEQEINTAEQIVERIGYLPLGINQAANLIIQDACSLKDFLEAYNNRELIEDSQSVKLIRNSLSHYPYSLRTVWNMNFERLNKDQQRLMNIMAFLDPDRVQQRPLIEGATSLKNPALRFMSTANKIHKCKVALLRSSLVSQNEKLRELRMHRLVQASCHLRMTKEERQENFRLAVALVKHSWPVSPRTALHDPSLWPDQQAMLPHVQSLCQYYVDSCREDSPLIPADVVDWDFPSILYEAGWFCHERGLFESVSELLIPGKEYCLQRESNGGEIILADIHGGLGALSTETNQFQSAYDYYQRQWHYLQKAFDSGKLQRPSMWEVYGYGCLGNALQGLHKYTEAEHEYRQCLEAWKTVPGDQKLFTTHLATCLWLQGRLDEAEQTVIGIIEDRNDSTNFRTGQALFSLGNIQIAQAEKLYKDKAKDAQERYQEAYETHAQALYLYKVTLGPRHHKTADAYHKIAWHFHQQFDYGNAMANLLQALDIYSTNPRFFKNEIARTKYKMGCVYQDMGDRTKGRAAIEEAQRLRKEIMPPERWTAATDEQCFDDLVMFWTR